MRMIDGRLKDKLVRLSKALVGQDKARVLIYPMENSPGFWFGSGNMVEDSSGIDLFYQYSTVPLNFIVIYSIISSLYNTAYRIGIYKINQ